MASLRAEFARTRAQFEAAFVARRHHERALVSDAFGPSVAHTRTRPHEVDELVARVLRSSDAATVLRRFGYRRVGNRMVYWVESTTPCDDINLDAPLRVDAMQSALVNHILVAHVLCAPTRGTKRADTR